MNITISIDKLKRRVNLGKLKRLNMKELEKYALTYKPHLEAAFDSCLGDLSEVEAELVKANILTTLGQKKYDGQAEYREAFIQVFNRLKQITASPIAASQIDGIVNDVYIKDRDMIMESFLSYCKGSSVSESFQRGIKFGFSGAV